MNYAHIYITPNEANPLGVIGEVPGENGQTIKGHTLVDIMAQVARFPAALSFLFHCHGPGGDVMAGDQIHDYMEAMKAEGKRVDTITDGDIGSIMTKPFMAGQERIIGEGHKLYVHAPWVPHMEGNAKEITAGLESLFADENRLRNFYKQKTGISEAGLQGLMAGSSSEDGTFITADQAVALKFATKKSPSKIKAYALIKNSNMSTQTVGQKIALAIGQAIDSVLGNTQPPAAPAAPAPPAPKATVPLEMEGGMKLISSSEDPANLVGSDITDEAGQPIQDGPVKLADGRVLVMSGGKCTEVQPAAAAQAPTAPAAPAPGVPAPQPAPAAASAAELALQNQVKALTEELNTLKAVDVNALVANALNDFKAQYPGLGKAPTRAINTNGLGGDQPQGRTINLVMAQKREERKNQINKN